MGAITYTKARKNFPSVMNKVCEDSAPKQKLVHQQ